MPSSPVLRLLLFGLLLILTALPAYALSPSKLVDSFSSLASPSRLLRSREQRIQGRALSDYIPRSVSAKLWSQRDRTSKGRSVRSLKSGRWDLPSSRRPQRPPPPRLVAVGDLHGDYEKALASLQLSGVVNGKGKWVGGNAVLVQTGDVLDRGPDSLRVLRLVRRLQKEARKAGGRVVCLLGNHELMNLQRNYAYVETRELAKIGQEKWKRLFALDGKYGRDLAKLPVAVVEGEGPCRTLFVHAGVHPYFLQQGGLAAMNAAMGVAIAQDVALGGSVSNHLLLNDFGPVWYRGFAWELEDRVSDSQFCPLVRKSLELVNATRMVTGHTPQPGGISTRCDGALVIIDSGISKEYYGQQSAWECKQDGSAWAMGPQRPKQLVSPFLRSVKGANSRRADL